VRREDEGERGREGERQGEREKREDIRMGCIVEPRPLRSGCQSKCEKSTAGEECYIPPAPEAATLMNKAPMCMGISYCASKSLVEVALEDIMMMIMMMMGVRFKSLKGVRWSRGGMGP